MNEQEVSEVPTARTKRLKFTDTVDVTEEAKIATDNALETGAVDDMSVEDLKKHQEEITQKIQEKQEAEKKAVIEQIVNVVNTYNIPIDELVGALGGLKIKRKGVKAVQKYQDPTTGVTWSGRGKEPKWIQGKKRDKFLIP